MQWINNDEDDYQNAIDLSTRPRPDSTYHQRPRLSRTHSAYELRSPGSVLSQIGPLAPAPRDASFGPSPREPLQRSRMYSLPGLASPPERSVPRESLISEEKVDPAHFVEQHQHLENRINTPPPMSLAAQSAITCGDWPDQAEDAAKLIIFNTQTSRHDENAPKTANLNLAAAQRFVLARLQRRIIHAAARFYREPSRGHLTSDELEQLISEYCNAVRNLDYMRWHASNHAKENDEGDMFYLQSSKHFVRLAMEEGGLVPDHVLPAGQLPVARDQEDPQLPGFPKSVANKEADSEQFLMRLTMVSHGGMFVIVPMLIMATVPGKIASLVTTVVAMLAFAVGITFKTQLKADQVLAATAAYAAVLVVFVGTSLSSSNGI